MSPDLKAYIIATENNLSVLRDKLLPKYPTLSISGSNNVEQGIRTVLSRHILVNYDVLIIVTQNFVSIDTHLKYELSQMINTAGNYSAKNLPIYFCCHKDNTDYYNNLKKLMTNPNARIFPYDSLTVAEFEQIIKEVAVFKGNNKDTVEQNTERAILDQKLKSLQGNKNNYINRIFTKREAEGDEDFSRMRRVRDLISSHSKSNGAGFVERTYKDKEATLNEIRANLFNRTEQGTLETGNIVTVSEINDGFIEEQLKPDVASEKLREISIDYDDYMNYMEDLESIIAEVKGSELEDKSKLVVELMQERATIHKNAHLILADFITKIAESSVQHITDSIAEDLEKFSEVNEVNQLVGGKLKEIQIMKENRNKFKSELQSITERMHQLTSIVRDSLTEMGNNYRITAESMQKEMVDYASSNSVLVQPNQVVTVDKVIMRHLQEGYNNVSKNVNALINVSNTTVKNFMELVMKDEEIIGKQDETINILMTHKSKKILVLDNVVQVKSFGFMGPDGTGKTHSALCLATALAKHRKVILVDLNYLNPSLIHYNQLRDSSGGYWLNSFTIPLESFITLPVSNKLHSQLPFSDGLTIVQPTTSLTLDSFSRTVHKDVFVEQLISLIKQVMDFYENVVFILPQDISEIKDILKHIGKLFLVTDTNPNNFTYTNNIVKENTEELSSVPVKYLLLNKMSKGMQLEADYIQNNIGIPLTEYAYLKVPLFSESPSMKIQGKNPYKDSVVVSRIFNDIIKTV